MPDITNPELCLLITNVCKPHKNFDTPQTEQPFRFAWFEEFPWVYCCWWEDRIYCLPCFFFGHKTKGKSLQKAILKMTNSRKNIQKTSKCSKNT